MADYQENGVASTTRASLDLTTGSHHDSSSSSNAASHSCIQHVQNDCPVCEERGHTPKPQKFRHPRKFPASSDPNARVNRETSALRKRSKNSGLTSFRSNEGPCNICRHQRFSIIPRLGWTNITTHQRFSKIPRLDRHHHHQGPRDFKRNSCLPSTQLPRPDDLAAASTRRMEDSSDSSTEPNPTSRNATPPRENRNVPDTFLAPSNEGTVKPIYDLNNKRESDYPSNRLTASSQENETWSDFNQDDLRPIILDGANVGHQWGRTRFSAVGYNIVYNHFKGKYNYPDHKIVIVHKRVPSGSLREEDWAIIKDFKQKGILVHPPSRIVGDGETLIQSDDDVFCLNIAHNLHGIVITADHYRRYWDLYPEYRDVRLLKPTFVLGSLILPDDPERTKTDGIEVLGQRLVGFLTLEPGWDTPTQETARHYNETTNDHVTKIRNVDTREMLSVENKMEISTKNEATNDHVTEIRNVDTREMLSVENKMEISTKLDITQHPNSPRAFPYQIMERHRSCSHSGAHTLLLSRLTTDPGNWARRLFQMSTEPTSWGNRPETHRPRTKSPREILVDLVGSPTSSQVGRYSLMVVDRTTGRIETIPLVNRETETCATVLLNHWILKFGIPDRITCNDERLFANDSWLDLVKLMCTKQTVTSGHSHKENALAERMQRSLTGTMKETCQHLQLIMSQCPLIAKVPNWYPEGILPTPPTNHEPVSSHVTDDQATD